MNTPSVEGEVRGGSGKWWKGCCLVLLLLLIGAVVVGVLGVRRAQSQLVEPAGVGEVAALLEVVPGEGVLEIGSDLEESGIVSSRWLFAYHAWTEGKSGLIQIGEYPVADSMTIPEIVSVITQSEKSDVAAEVDVTFLEGWTLAQYADKLDLVSGIDGDEFLALAESPHETFEDYDFVAELPAEATLEGYLFPDTYRISEETTAEGLIRRMLSNFGTKIDTSLRVEVEESGRTLHEMVILASIVEREVFQPDEMFVVAGIFTNRINAGMKLESDATVNYAIGGDNPQPTFEQTEVDSPYNTYNVIGLPVGPISNPGINALMAAVRPADTNYFFFLTSLETGEVFYAKTFQEHLRNKDAVL